MSGPSALSRPDHQALLEGAVDWIVLLGSGRATEQDRQRFERWLASCPENARAWGEVNGVMAQPLAALREAAGVAPGHVRAARSALLRSGAANRRKLLKLALLLPGAGVTALAVDRYVPLAGLAATYATRTGERRSYQLEDGTVLTLNARSAADVRYDSAERRVLLRQGELYAETQPDSRPFIVGTRHGQVSTDAARLAVRLSAAYDAVQAFDGALLVQPPQGQALALQAPQAGAFDRRRAWLRDSVDQADWRRGVLTVRNDSLGEVVERLRAYQPGVIRLSPQAAALRVFGVFPLDAPDAALRALGETLPIRVRRYGPWLTLVDAA